MPSKLVVKGANPDQVHTHEEWIRVLGQHRISNPESFEETRRGDGLACMLDLSTSHLPGPTPNWGKLRVVEHEFGWTVFVSGDAPDEDIPPWIQPLWERAIQDSCLVINFDMDGELVEGLRTWDW